MTRFRKFLALALTASCLSPVGWAQQQAIAPQKLSGNILWRDYFAPVVPPARLSNGTRVRDLIQGGKLYLTAQDAIALALENNIDIESNRYNALMDASRLIRAQAGGPLPGVSSGVSQAGSVASGQGVSGSQSAAGVSSNGAGNGGSSGTTVAQIGPVTPTLDPVFSDVQSYSHKSAPQYNLTQSAVTNLIQNTRNYNASISSGFLTGGKASLTYTDSYLNENAPTDLLNPSNGVAMQLQVQQPLLYGFGVALNSRNITIAKANLKIDDLNFQTEVIGVVVSVLNDYYALVADYQDVKAKQGALVVAKQFYADNKKQVEIGTMAPLDVTTAEAQAATSEQDLVISQTSLEQDEVTLKNAISRNGLADPLLASVQVVPLDRIEVPESDNLPSAKEMTAMALANRADLAANKLNLINSERSALGTKNGILPTLVVAASLKNAGLAGTAKTIPIRGATGISAGAPGFIPCPPALGGPSIVCEAPPQSLVGGVGTAIGQVARRDYPSESFTSYVAGTMRNQTAQADLAIDQLGLRQTALENQRTLNQVAVDISNQSIALQQARARYLAATKNRVLQEQLLQAEQRKFALGASTTFAVVQQERDLSTAQSTEVAALVSYSNARVALDQTLGTTLTANHIAFADAQSGFVGRKSVLKAPQ